MALAKLSCVLLGALRSTNMSTFANDPEVGADMLAVAPLLIWMAAYPVVLVEHVPELQVL